MKSLTILLFCFFLHQNPNCNYSDSCGNKIIIESVDKLPKTVDSTFFKNNFSSSILKKEYCEKKYKFEFRIVEVKKVSKNKYAVMISTNVIRENVGIEEVLKYNGNAYYLMKTKKANKKTEIENIKLIYREL